MIELKIPKRMITELDKFLSSKTCTDIDRTKFIPFDFNGVRDTVNKLTTCFIFNCNCHSYEDPTFIYCEHTGAVVHLPAFWLEVPKELAFTYIMNILNDDLYNGTYKQWAIDGYIGGESGTSSGGTSNAIANCPCNDNWQYV